MARGPARPIVALVGVLAALMLLSTLFHDQAQRVEVPSEVPFDPTRFMDQFDPNAHEPPEIDPSEFDPSDFDPSDFEDFDPSDFEDFDPEQWDARNPPPRDPEDLARWWYQMPPGGGLPPPSGGGGGSGGGGSGGGGTDPDVPPEEFDEGDPPPEGEPTTTVITDWPDSIAKGQTFTVVGTVARAEGGLPGAPVRLYISPDKDAAGHFAGHDTTDQAGRFSITATFPADLPPAQYQLLAQHTGTTLDGVYYAPSWSDPPFSVTGEGFLVATVPEVVRSNDEVAVFARLTDQDGVPVPGQTVTLEADGISRQAETDQDGGAAFALRTPDEATNLDLEFTFAGTDHLSAASDRATLQVVRVSFDWAGSIPAKAMRGQDLFVGGSLSVDGFGPSSMELQFRADGVGSAFVTASRLFPTSFEMFIPPDAPLGQTWISAYSPELGANIGQWPLWIQAAPQMEISTGGAYAEGTRPIGFVSVVDEDQRALENVLVVATGAGITQQARTDSLGRAAIPYPVDGDDTVTMRLRIEETTALQPSSSVVVLEPVELKLEQVGTLSPGPDQDMVFRMSAGGRVPDVSFAHARGLGRDWTGTVAGEELRFEVDVAEDAKEGGYIFELSTDLPGHSDRVMVQVSPQGALPQVPVLPVLVFVLIAATAGILWWRRDDLAEFVARFDGRPVARVRLSLAGHEPGWSLAMAPGQRGELVVAVAQKGKPKDPSGGGGRDLHVTVACSDQVHRLSGKGPWRVPVPILADGEHQVRVQVKGGGLRPTRIQKTLHVADWNVQLGREFQEMWDDLDPQEPLARTPRTLESWLVSRRLAPADRVADAVLAVEVANYTPTVASFEDWARFARLRAAVRAGAGP